MLGRFYCILGEFYMCKVLLKFLQYVMRSVLQKNVIFYN